MSDAALFLILLLIAEVIFFCGGHDDKPNVSPDHVSGIAVPEIPSHAAPRTCFRWEQNGGAVLSCGDVAPLNAGKK